VEKNLRSKVIQVLKDDLLIKEEIKDTDNIVDDLGADDLDMLEICMALEEELHIEIPDEDIEEIETVGDLIKVCERKLSEDSDNN
jgi:acyl carrier protein